MVISKTIKIGSAAILAALFVLLFTFSQNDKSKEFKYKSSWKSIQNNYKIPEWYTDAKFGIFVHWGPYSVPAYGSEWYPRFMYMDSIVVGPSGKIKKNNPSSTYEYHLKTYGHPKKFGYKDFIPMFKGEKFDANQWMNLFKESGAKYVIPVAEHHDAFAMYDSQFTKWNASNMGPKRDILGELMESGRNLGLKVGASSHYAFNWDYFHLQDNFDNSDPKYAALYGIPHEPYGKISNEFLKTWWNRTTDIIDNYNPDILFFDFMIDRDEFKSYHPKLASYYYNKGLEWDKEVVLQSKNFRDYESFPPGTHLLDYERGKQSEIRKQPWQTDTSIGKNSWCYTVGWESKSVNSLVDDLVDIVSKNGNLLLNVGPKADGTIPEEQKDVLLKLGEWLKANGEAIYGTKPWKIHGEGPTVVPSGHHSEQDAKEFTDADFRFTTKKDVLYVIALEPNEQNIYYIKCLSDGNALMENQIIDEINSMDSNEVIDWQRDNHSLKVSISNANDSKLTKIFKIKLKSNV